ncbi:MAG: type II toxin-antitoxin system RelE/ParE family toxin [Bacteroidales bacterium]|jgi:plasmid stabilization system protein ParE|nr:type II toxin-antitoxin system RelE/ParE family toxin [Bacteroidales bacterium]
MVKRKIVWSHRANIKLFEILDFYAERNKSNAYSKKLYKKFKKELSLLIKQPEIGTKTDMESVRGLIVEEFILFYEFTSEMIIVHSVWDCRQNPDDFRIK